MLTLTFLGVGSAFAKRNFQSNALVEAWSTGPGKQATPDDTLLIDFGTTGPAALHQLKAKPGFGYLDRHGLVNYPAIRRVFISHLHADHIGGLEEMAAMNAYAFAEPETGEWFKPEIISSTEVLVNLWEYNLKEGLGILHGRYALLQDCFRVRTLRPVDKGEPHSFTMVDRYEFTIFSTDHLRVQRRYDWPSLGLRMTDLHSGATVTYSGDSRFDPEGLGARMSAARRNFHEVQLADCPAPVHALLSELRTLPEKTRRKTLLYHYDDSWESAAYGFVAEEFAGFARPGHRYVLFE